MAEGGQNQTRLKMEYQSLREKSFQIFKATKIMEKKIDVMKREIKFLQKQILHEKHSQKNFLKYVSLEKFPKFQKKTFVVGNEIELSEMALAAQGEEIKGEEEQFESPDPLKREQGGSKKKKSSSKKDLPTDGDKFQSPKRKGPSKRKENTVVVIKLSQEGGPGL